MTTESMYVWRCPTHGIVDEGELAEGVDWSAGTDIEVGDVAWTDRFYCQRDHAGDEAHECKHIEVVPAHCDCGTALMLRCPVCDNDD